MCDVIELDGEVANENAETENIVDATTKTNRLSSSVKKMTKVSAKAVNVNQLRNAQRIDHSTVSKANELDKFKRRLIRVIARSLLVEKKPEEEIWEELKKQTSCDCKLLWSRMRAVTVKKLRRLFVAEDKTKNITKIAQLSVTDWLLIDLVLVHENVDVIGQEEQDTNKKQKDAKVLEDLFHLVVKHKIEDLKSDELTKAWYDLTQEYNCYGRKCSPMLLQRRWFQLKELVWYNFYNFWFSYRGDARRLSDAIHYKPTTLQREVIKRFTKIVTQQFPSWEQLIEEKKVSLPTDFERLQLSNKKRKFAENEPDLVVIEPQVETIDLRLESDSELNDEDSENESDSNKANEKTTKSQLDITIVKTETIDDVSDEDDIRVLEGVHIPLEPLEPTVNLPSSNDDVLISDAYTLTHPIDYIAKNNGESNQSSDVVITDEKDTRNKELSENSNQNFEEIDYSDDPLIIDDDYSHTTKLENKKETEHLGDRQLILPTKNTAVEPFNLENNGGVRSENDDLNDVPFIDGLELEDEGIEYFEDEDDIAENETKMKISRENKESLTKDHEKNNAPKIDVKLLLDPVVYTKRLDDMNVFRFINYETVKDRLIIKKALLESSPVDKKSINMEGIIEESLERNESSCNESLSSYDCQDRISIKSWYFQKPKVVSYNPIQLCKNPDFNTRLKRLTAGFFSCERNRRLLKECKPLTIDVHKSFERKLSNNSLLVDGFRSRVANRRESIKTFNDTVIPSVPVKTFTVTRLSSSVSYNSLNNTENILLNIEQKQILPKTFTSNIISSNAMEPNIERNKVINLPDVNQIRWSNEKLLIAEVSPIQCKSNKNQFVEIFQEKYIKTDNDSVNINNNPEKSVLDSFKLTDNTLSKVLNTSDASDQKSQPVLEEKADKNGELEKLGVQVKGKLFRKPSFKPKTSYNKKVAPPPPSSTTTQPKIPEFVRKGMPTDRLLALDTVERILNVCQGEIINKKGKKRKYTIRATQKKAKWYGQSASEKPNYINEVTDTPNVVAPHEDEADKQDSQSQLKNTASKVKNRKEQYCCWSRRQIKFLKERKIRFRAHTCPELKCICCCQKYYREELEKMQRKKYLKTITGSIDYVDSDEEEDAFQKTRRVSVSKEININYDPEFAPDLETSKTCHKINENTETSDKCLSINISNDNQPQASVLTEEVSYPKDSFTEGLNPIITNVQSLSKPIATTAQLQGTNNTNKMKCKTNIVFSPGPFYLTSPIKPTNPIPETSKNVNSLTPDSKDYAMNNVWVINDKSEKTVPETPISLGKNKILLSSVKSIEEIDNTVAEQIAPPDIMNHDLLPPGVHLTLLSNNELTFSIDPGVELDSTQLSNLPVIMSSVQEELNSPRGKALIESLTKNYRSNTSAVHDNFVTLLNDNSELKPSDQNRNQDNTNINVETIVAVDNLKMVVFGTEDTSNLVESVVECVTESSKEVTNAEVNKNIILNEESTLVNEVQEDSKQLINHDEPTNQNKKNEHNVVSNITQDSSKKPILSDLMEMSGISVEDTSIASIEKDSVEDISETKILETQPLVNPTFKGLLSTTSSSVIDNVTYTVSNTVNKAICPELKKVTTYQELQYAFNKSGKFYKMNIETGKITPIKIEIKKKLVQKPILAKTVIDLTDDVEKEELELGKNNPKQPKITMEPPKAIKPVRLLKAIHPAILKRSGGSILIKPHEGKLDAKFKKKNVIHIIKRKRKQDIKITNVVSSVELQQVSNIDKNIISSNRCSGSESDDEPLALKAKRRKENDLIEAVEEEPEDKSQGESACENQKVDNLLEDDVNTEPPAEEEPVGHSMNTVLEPVAFNDSSDDDCILGV